MKRKNPLKCQANGVGEDEFQNKFTTRADGNETLVLYRETDLPLKVRLNEMEQIQIQSSPSRMEN